MLSATYVGMDNITVHVTAQKELSGVLGARKHCFNRMAARVAFQISHPRRCKEESVIFTVVYFKLYKTISAASRFSILVEV